MGQSSTSPAVFNPVPHLIGIGLLGAANPLIYVGRFDLGAWLAPLLGVALLVGLIGGGYRLLAPAQAKAAGLKPFILLAWLLVALVTLQSWTEGRPAAANTPQAISANSAAPPANSSSGFDAANAVLVSPPPATKDFDPTNAVLVEIRP
ncbi:hypothetical protein QYQ99_22460 [Comamonas testosteroni]|uniref:hypothetical protein n=1 Tax=Comamonas testosteroni TaxID=285 RepID=UPI00265FA7AE|nr:hypothetical protein [Comamonas testosteroni]WKL15096.1 hypothetical protein QYQ99_22460 [Comamonas testosteroni]